MDQIQQLLDKAQPREQRQLLYKWLEISVLPEIPTDRSHPRVIRNYETTVKFLNRLFANILERESVDYERPIDIGVDKEGFSSSRSSKLRVLSSVGVIRAVENLNNIIQVDSKLSELGLVNCIEILSPIMHYIQSRVNNAQFYTSSVYYSFYKIGVEKSAVILSLLGLRPFINIEEGLKSVPYIVAEFVRQMEEFHGLEKRWIEIGPINDLLKAATEFNGTLEYIFSDTDGMSLELPEVYEIQLEEVPPIVSQDDAYDKKVVVVNERLKKEKLMNTQLHFQRRNLNGFPML